MSSHLSSIIATALLWGAGGAVVAWMLTWPLRRRSQAGTLISTTLVATGSSVAAVFGNTRAMFLATDDELATVTVAIVGGVLAALAAAWSARTFALDHKSLLADIGALREERLIPDDGRRLSGELERLRTDLAETALTLADSRNRERALEASRRELLAWVSHDLRTPMAGLRAMAEALEDGVAEDPDRYHKQMRAEVDRLTVMVDDLFELSRLQAGAGRGESDQINLTDLISDCLASLTPVADAHSVSLVGQADGVGPIEVYGRDIDLSRAVTNLIVNAIRHTGPGGVVTVRLGTSGERDDVRAEVSVQDECGGIRERDLPRLFDVGYRGESARTPASDFGAGAGLGLAITRGIVAAHHGMVDVHNVPDGCRFTLRLPAVATREV